MTKGIRMGAALAFALLIAVISGIWLSEPASGQGGAPPAAKQTLYYPNAQELGPDEMRVVALGTGMPSPLTKAQKSAAWLVELGNGDKFIFDIGTGSMENIFALRPDFSKLDKVFLSHLHTDHFGDLDGLLVGGWLSGRYTPLHVYGPTGSEPALGTAAAVDGLLKTYAWDIKGRSGALPDEGGKVIAHEFDYREENGVIYNQNGVKVTAFPAIHSLDGSVSFRLEWNGLSFIYGGDSFPNKWFIQYASNADFVIHECIYTPEGIADFFGWGMRQATYVSTRIHTPPDAFGKIMSAVKPRLAVAYHSILLPEKYQEIVEGIRSTYSGPLAVASDLDVWIVTKDSIRQMEAVVSERPYPPPVTPGYVTAKRSGEAKMSEYIMSGAWEGYQPPPLPEQ